MSDADKLGTVLLPLFGQAWELLGLKWPGLNISFRDVFLGCAVISLSLWVLNYVFGLGGSGRGGGQATRTRTGRRHKTSKEREGDEY